MRNQRNSRWIRRVGVFVPVLVAGAVAAWKGEAAPVLDLFEVELPIRDVTVFSDRARVTRRAEVKVNAPRVRLPLLPTTVDPSSIRLEASGVVVKGIEVRQAEKDEFPRSEAQKLIETIERLQREVRATSESLEPLQRERSLLLGIRPQSSPMPDPKGQPVALDPTGWLAANAFFEEQDRAFQEAAAPIEQQLRKQRKELEFAIERARQVAAASQTREGYVVDAILGGTSKGATLSLTYSARGARWYPTYDVRWTAGATQVDLDLGAFVAQETGEEWTDAQLTLSTAIPAQAPVLPELATWKLGRKERFIPTPVAQYQPPQNPPVMPQPVPIERDTSDEELRERLMLAINEAVPVKRAVGGRAPSTGSGLGYGAGAAPPPPSAPMPQPRPSAPRREMERSMSKRSAAPEPAMAMAAPAEDDESYDMGMAVSETTSAIGDMFRGPEPVRQSIPFGAPASWRMPSFAADLPAALAGGYTFTYTSARRESIPSGGGARKVALTSVRLPADPVVRLYPALRKEAFVTAEMKNTREIPLLQGRAKIFVGGDLSGEATIPTTATGQTVTLALGIDDALKVERNVKVLDGEQGFLGSQEVSNYDVTIELGNPRDRAVKVRVLDQLPRPADKQKIEVKLVSVDPKVTPDDAEGTLDWTIEIPAAGKKVLTYRYSFARPKNWLPYQSTQPMGKQP